MDTPSSAEPNVSQVVPFFRVADMPRSIAFYVDGLGFTIRNRWDVDGQLRWCWLGLGGASLMLQTYVRKPEGKLGEGVSLAFQCRDAIALYREFLGRGLHASEPQVGNSMWVTCLTDPDGYLLEFESSTDAPEETKLSELGA